MNKLFLIIIMIFGISIICYPNNQTIDLDLDTSIDMALKTNLNIEKEKLKLESYKWAMVSSWNNFIPDMNFKVYLNHVDDNSLTKKSLSNDTYIYNPNIPDWSIGFDYNLTFNFNASVIFNIYQTTLDWKNGKLTLDDASKKIIRDVKKKYYSLIMFRENLLIISNKINSAKTRYDQAVSKREIGASIKTDELSAKASYENIKFTYMEIENSYKNSILEFKQMIGLKDEIEPNLKDNVPELKSFQINDTLFSDIFEKNADKNFDIQISKINVQKYANYKNSDIAFLTPTFIFSYNYDPYYINDPFNPDKMLFNSGNKWIERSGYLTFSLSLPLGALIPFSKEQIKIIKDEYAVKEMQNNLAQIKNNTKLELKSLILNIGKNLKSIELLKLNIELSQEAYSRINDAYKIGEKKLIEVVDAENELNNAKLNLLRQEYEYYSNILDIEYLLNAKIDDVLKTVN